MAIIIDPVTTHDGSNTGNNTVPPGITGQDWCHCCSDANGTELTTFITTNVLTIGALATNIRTPTAGSIRTYIGLTSAQRDAAIAAGAQAFGAKHVVANCFDGDGTNLYEPIS